MSWLLGLKRAAITKQRFLFSHFTWVPTCNHLGFKDLFLMEILTVAAAAAVVFRHVPALAFCHWLQCWSQPLPELCLLLLLLLLLLVQFAFSCNFCLFSYWGGGGCFGSEPSSSFFLISRDFSFVVAVVVLGCDDVVWVFLSSSL